MQEQRNVVLCFPVSPQFTNARPDCVDGVVYMGSPSAGLESSLKLPVLYILGSRDSFTLDAVSRSQQVRSFETELAVLNGCSGWVQPPPASVDIPLQCGRVCPYNLMKVIQNHVFTAVASSARETTTA